MYHWQSNPKLGTLKAKDPVRCVMQVVRISSSPILNESMLDSDKSSELKINRQAIQIKSKHTHTDRANLKPERT